MGICSSGIKKQGVVTIQQKGKESEQFEALTIKFQKEIKSNPIFNFNSTIVQEKLISLFENSNTSPNVFISSQSKYPNMFKKQFTLSYLKSEPLLNNIYPSSDKQTGVLFMNLILFMLSYGTSMERKMDLANKLVLEAFDHSQKKFDMGRLREIIRNVINICIIIIIYFGALFLFLNEEMKNKIFINEENIQVDGRYDVSSLDDYFFHRFITVRKEISEEFLISIWEDFIFLPLKPENNSNSAHHKKHEPKFVFENTYLSLSENTKDDINHRLCHMFDSFTFFEVFLNLQVPEINNINKSSKNQKLV
jgi:hypothetical protein